MAEVLANLAEQLKYRRKHPACCRPFGASDQVGISSGGQAHRQGAIGPPGLKRICPPGLRSIYPPGLRSFCPWAL